MLDALLLLMIVIWGSNFALVKAALADFPPLVFNALRLIIASSLFLVAIAVEARARRGAVDQPRAGRALSDAARPRLTRADWRRLIFLALLGHVVYQVCFVAGVARTSVGNAALIFGCTPVTVSFLAALAGHERIPRLRWVGAALSLMGIYAVVGHRAEWSAAGLTGDAIVIVAMFCWSLYSVASQPLLRRHSALVVTGVSMSIGAVCYAIIALPSFIATDWGSISGLNWALMTASAAFGLGFAYVIWYTGIQRIGSSRTAMYTNLTPIVAMIVGALWLAEPITRAQIIGTVAILAGVAVTRLAPKSA